MIDVGFGAEPPTAPTVLVRTTVFPPSVRVEMTTEGVVEEEEREPGRRKRSAGAESRGRKEEGRTDLKKRNKAVLRRRGGRSGR